jgi:hypothetical protein
VTRMDSALPLPTLLSQVLVAFTIEFDNEFEHRMPHRTTTGGGRQGPWLVSMAMWFSCMRFVDEQGISVRDLEARARTKTNLNGMKRWGYIVEAADGTIRPTSHGRKAREVWQLLPDTIEKRWEERLGEPEIAQLRESLAALVAKFEIPLPDCVPILGYGLFSRVPAKARPAPAEPMALPALLARVLLAFAIEFEKEAELSLATCANLLRVLNEEEVRARDLPALSGVSKEAIATAAPLLVKRRLAVLASGTPRVAKLTRRGLEARDAYRRRLDAIEERWKAQFGAPAIREVRAALEQIIGDATPESPLFLGLVPYPDGWRAKRPQPHTLPHFPMVLHRGGFPDGS